MPSRPRSIRDSFRQPAAKEPEQSAKPATRAASERPLQRKFTVLLDVRDADAFTRLTAQLQERLPARTVRKSDVVRALVALAGDDATLRDQVLAELQG